MNICFLINMFHTLQKKQLLTTCKPGWEFSPFFFKQNSIGENVIGFWLVELVLIIVFLFHRKILYLP